MKIRFRAAQCYCRINIFSSIAIIFLLFTLSCSISSIATIRQDSSLTTVSQDEKPRLLVLTDIGGDPDDQQSLIRLMLYANEFDIEGIIATASGTPGELKEAVVKPELIREIIQAYGQVQPNLLKHHPDYPLAQHLLGLVKIGNPQRGVSHIGEGHDTEGSDWIIEATDREDSRPLNIVIWGGQSDLAQALWKVKNTRRPKQYQEFVARLRIYDIMDQDGIYSWIAEQFPDLFYILNRAPEGQDKRNAVFRGMYLGGDESLTSQAWITTHIKEDHGPLGALYPIKTWTAPNPHGVLKEGDTPSWFYFLPTGLSNPEEPGYGSWGGRFASGDTHFVDAVDQVEDKKSARATVWRWRPHYQNDFSARMDWCVQSYAQANHPPKVLFNSDTTSSVVHLEASPGDKLPLSAVGSIDPDQDDLTYQWTVYPEAGTYTGRLSIENDTFPNAYFIVPEADESATIHVVLTATDEGSPKLSRYRRIVVTVNN